MTTTEASAPSEWSEEVKNTYSPIRPLGDGGFGSVWLARRNVKLEHEKSKLAAIKVIGGRNTQSSTASYALREIAILSELSHPNIVRIVESFEQDGKNNDGNNDNTKKGSAVFKEYIIAMSYAPGYTLEELLNYRGALGIPMAIHISTQLVNAVAYLHSRAVLHRDIKPDNMLIKGAKLDDEACWSDDNQVGITNIQKGTWTLTLVDFGFARALHPDELSGDIGFHNTIRNVAHNSAAVNYMSVDKKPIMKKGELDQSISHNTIMDLSSLGNRNYAAPEILKTVHQKNSKESSSSRSNRASVSRNPDKGKNKREALTECVSNYGLVADSFSVGITMRYILTGVPPTMTVDEYVSSQSNVLALICSCLFSGNNKNKPKKRIRYSTELPKELSTLVLGLTHWDANKRTTVRAAKAYLKNFCNVWFGGQVNINDDDEANENTGMDESENGLHHLKFVFDTKISK